MGNSESVPIPGGGSEGYHVLKIQNNSPAQAAGLEAYFDFIVAVGNIRLDRERGDKDKESLKKVLEAHENKPLELTVFNSKTQTVRQTQVVPSKDWGGEGLLGVSIRFCSFDGANQNVWHIIDVQPGSPAAAAGLCTDSDYVLGAESVLQQSDDLVALVQSSIGQQVKLYVYNVESDGVREVTLVPNNDWGGEGCLGCDIGYGYLHRIPISVDRSKPIATASAVGGTASGGMQFGQATPAAMPLSIPPPGATGFALLDQNPYSRATPEPQQLNGGQQLPQPGIRNFPDPSEFIIGLAGSGKSQRQDTVISSGGAHIPQMVPNSSNNGQPSDGNASADYQPPIQLLGGAPPAVTRDFENSHNYSTMGNKDPAQLRNEQAATPVAAGTAPPSFANVELAGSGAGAMHPQQLSPPPTKTSIYEPYLAYGAPIQATVPSVPQQQNTATTVGNMPPPPLPPPAMPTIPTTLVGAYSSGIQPPWSAAAPPLSPPVAPPMMSAYPTMMHPPFPPAPLPPNMHAQAPYSQQPPQLAMPGFPQQRQYPYSSNVGGVLPPSTLPASPISFPMPPLSSLGISNLVQPPPPPPPYAIGPPPTSGAMMSSLAAGGAPTMYQQPPPPSTTIGHHY